jgi:L-asparaginase
VVEAMGGGHVPSRCVEPLAELASRMPVVLASRTGNGEALRQTYDFPGSEMDLLRQGLIPSGPLDGPKARVLLSLLLRSGASREEITQGFVG